MDSKALPRLRMRKNTLADIRDPLGLRPSAVELYSRLLFPVAFIAFQVSNAKTPRKILLQFFL